METGNGLGVVGLEVTFLVAAMEPGLGDREWLDGPEPADHVREPQWSPVLETGNGPDGHPVNQPRQGAAMEPGLGDREWPTTAAAPSQTTSRNGARSWRPGMAVPGPPAATRHEAAMEPGLGDREWICPMTGTTFCPMPQWSPVLETGNGATSPPAWTAPAACRNGARSWRPGMGRTSGGTTPMPLSGRNGARSWRPGMAAAA